MSDSDLFRRHLQSEKERGEQEEKQAWCKTCYESEGVLKRAVYSRHRGGWICEEGHLNQDVVTLT